MKFTKMHGCGNDYVYINGFTEQIPQDEKPDFVRAVSDRHFGVGGDGAIFINPIEGADFEMEMFNADGTRAEMCGNGIRCVAKYVYDHGMTDKTEDLEIISGGAKKYLNLTVEDGKAVAIRVNMGAPILKATDVPVDPDTLYVDPANKAEKNADGYERKNAAGEVITDYADAIINEAVTVDGQTYHITCVSMGNPHAIVYMDGVADLEIEKIGPSFENHAIFPNRTNTEFVEIVDRKTVNMRVWERGTGETLACGTGCCATVVACILNGLTDDTVTVNVLGGQIEVTWDKAENLVYMTGPATTVFEGEFPWK